MAEIYFTLQPRFAPADSLEGIGRVLATGQIPVWLPLQMSQVDDAIPKDWTITSDGLAARLTERLSSARIVLLKACEVDPTATVSQLADEGIVDPVFPKIVARAGLDWRVLGPEDEAELRGLLGLELVQKP